MDGTAGPSSVDQLNAPYAKRWELLKDVMVRLYMKEEKPVKEIAKFMEMEYKFYASSVVKARVNAMCADFAASINTNVNSASGMLRELSQPRRRPRSVRSWSPELNKAKSLKWSTTARTKIGRCGDT
jgi:hypothetical protein